MRKLHVIAFVGASLCCVMLGYVAGAVRHTQPSDPDLGEFITLRTFSETANARAILQAERLRFLNQWRADFRDAMISSHSMPLQETRDSANSVSGIKEMIATLEAQLPAFRGTAHEHILRQYLMLALTENKNPGAWLDAYRTLIYEEPENEWVIQKLEDAVRIAKALGRQNQLAKDLLHWVNIPLGFARKTHESDRLVADTLQSLPGFMSSPRLIATAVDAPRNNLNHGRNDEY